MEFWLKKDEFDTTKTDKEVVLDLWNKNTVNTSTYGRFRLSFDDNSSSPQFIFTTWSGSNASGVGKFETAVSNTITLGAWQHYALSVIADGTNLITRFYVNGDLIYSTTNSHNYNEEFTSQSFGHHVGTYDGKLYDLRCEL